MADSSRRVVGRPWPKGVSGNPGGRHRDGEVRALAREHTEEAIRALAKIMNTRNAPAAARVSAANVLLDRGWGRPAQAITGADGEPLLDLSRLSDEQLAQFGGIVATAATARADDHAGTEAVGGGGPTTLQ